MKRMVTHITLEDGRILGTSNGVFDCLLERVAKELGRRTDAVDGLREWLLDQRCEVQGPGVGYLDLRELSPRASSQFKSACISAYNAMRLESSPVIWLDQLSLLMNMWISIEKGEPPEALSSPHLLITPWSGDRRGPGWE
jgi:hypothetical protein